MNTEYPRLSIVIPIRNEAPNIPVLCKELIQAVGPLGLDWEILWIDDASTDDSGEAIAGLKNNSVKMNLIRLVRNYGQAAALACGFEEARGDIIITIDGDLQNDPADIPKLLACLEQGFDVVCGWRENRRDDPFRSFMSRLANRVIRKITDCSINDYGCTLRAYKRAALGGLQIMGDMHRLLPAYLAWQGAKITEIPVHHRSRRAGKSKYSVLGRTWKVILDAFLLKFYFSYITRPIHFFGSVSLGIILTALALEVFVIFRRIFMGGAWLSPLFFLGLFLFSGALFFLFLGVLADLLVRNFMLSHNMKPFHLAFKKQL
ncbi:MAG: glycosyltransferase family 2 protein [Elusimicrobia bacterium]|nr:glycosyltransferase family 2 protein [Elusimicrobiota bacterium]